MCNYAARFLSLCSAPSMSLATGWASASMGSFSLLLITMDAQHLSCSLCLPNPYPSLAHVLSATWKEEEMVPEKILDYTVFFISSVYFYFVCLRKLCILIFKWHTLWYIFFIHSFIYWSCLHYCFNVSLRSSYTKGGFPRFLVNTAGLNTVHLFTKDFSIK